MLAHCSLESATMEPRSGDGLAALLPTFSVDARIADEDASPPARSVLSSCFCVGARKSQMRSEPSLHAVASLLPSPEKRTRITWSE